MTKKEKTLKWLQFNFDEINNNMVGMKMTDEDIKLNEKDLKEISECIEWVNNLKK